MVEALARLRDNPWAGAENRARAGSRHIVDGRHVYFDREGYQGRHPGDKRFRIVYRLEPDEGAPTKATVYAIAERRGYAPTGWLKAAGRAPSRDDLLRGFH